MKILTSLTLLHQTGALSYETSYGTNTHMERPDIDKTQRYVDFKSLNSTNQEGEGMKFDTDSASLYIDSCITSGLTGFKEDFIPGSYYEIEEKLSDTTTGKASIIGEGIAACTFKDNNGEFFTLHTKMAYAPMSKYRLMAPQCLGMQEKDKGVPKDKRSTCKIDDEEVVVTFDDQRRNVTIKHDPKMLVPVLNVNPGIKKFQSFNIAFKNVIQNEEVLADDMVGIDDLELYHKNNGVALNAIDSKTHLNNFVEAVDLISKNADLEDKLLKIQKEAKLIGTSATLNKDQQELLRIHERYNHVISMPDIQVLAAAGHFPKRLSKCTRPACATCCYGAAGRKPWRSKGKHNKEILESIRTLPGEIAHTDIMTSSVPGLIAQMVGFLTSKKFYHTSLFIDNKSDYTFVHHQQSTSADETIVAKKAYELELRKYGKEVRHYQADNGTYATAKYKEEIEERKQTITFCGVGGHDQNGRAENRIKIICNPDRSMLIHAMHRWSEVITQSLWPYSVSLAVDIRNKHKIDKEGFSAFDRLTSVKKSFNLKDNHTFGCPAYVLNASLQDHNTIPRWDERIRVGVYLGRSKQHASNVALILNLKIGHISPLFHIVFDDNFETVDAMRNGVEPKRWKWLVEHKREYHLNDNREIIDGTKIWTDSELESSILFEVPKDNLKDDRSSSVANTPSLSEEHNKKDETASSTDNTEDINRSRNHLILNNKAIVEATNSKKRATKFSK